MNEIREILTKAVIGRGQKTFEMDVKLPKTSTLPDRTLGAFITNHQMNVRKSGDVIELFGKYDLHVWYAHGGDTETEIARTTIEYGNTMELQNALRDHLLETDEITCEEIVAPYATNLRVEDGLIHADTQFEVGVEVIGETKMRVAILGPVLEAPAFEQLGTPSDYDDLSEIDGAINENFLEAVIEPFE